MYFAGFKILIFILIHEIVASKYYYKKKDGTYDVYYGPRAIWGYKEFKSPKSYKDQFKDRGDRPGNCSSGNFLCREPFQVKETEVFECDLDYQCPNYFKCCQVTCFQHKICQPAITDDCEDNEIPTFYPTVEKSTETFTNPSTTISTSSVTWPTTNFTTIYTTADTTTRRYVTTSGTKIPVTSFTTSSELRSTTEATISSLNTDTTILKTEKPSTPITEKTPETSSATYTTLEHTEALTTQATTLKTEISVALTTEKSFETPSTLVPSTTVTKTARTKSTSESQETSSQITEKQSQMPSTPNLTTNTNKNDITTDDEDLNFSGDEELDISTPDEKTLGSTITLKTTITITSLKPDTKPITTASETTKTPTTTPISFTTKQFSETTENKLPSSILTTLTSQRRTTQPIDITDDDEDLSFSGDYEASIDNISTSSDKSSSVAKSTTTFSRSSTESSTISTAKAVETSTVDQNEHNPSIKSTESSTVTEPTIISRLTSDFSTSTVKAVEISIADEYDSNTSIKSTKSDSTIGPTSTEVFSSLITTESVTSTEKSGDENKIITSTQMTKLESPTGTSMRSGTPQGMEPSEATTSAHINRETEADDEDLSFSGNGGLGVNTEDKIASTLRRTDTTNKPTSVKTTIETTTYNSVKPSSRPVTITERNTNTKHTDADDEDLVFSGSGDNQIKLTTEIFHGSSIKQEFTSPESGNDDEDFSFNEIGKHQSTIMSEIITKEQVQSTTEFTTGNVDYITPESIAPTSTDSSSNSGSPTDKDISSHTNSILSGTITTSANLVANTENVLIAESTTINDNNIEGNLPNRTGIIFVNSLLGVLKKVPETAMTSNQDDADHYFNNFLALLGKIPNLIREAGVENEFLISDSNTESTQSQIITTETEAPNR